MSTPPTAGPLLLDADDLARELGVSAKTIRRMDAAGKLPRPIRLSRRATRWRRETVSDWLRESERAGRLVDRREFEQLQEADGR